MVSVSLSGSRTFALEQCPGRPVARILFGGRPLRQALRAIFAVLGVAAVPGAVLERLLSNFGALSVPGVAWGQNFVKFGPH